ncbi:hypothetical protein L208DRAFT_1267524 [Tricholoma matsutake]|nr:hypothetical protein L208DRAFT_1267524 [Tricholoma matsutake 945]
MVKKTKVQHQAEYLKYANDIFEYAVALNDNDDDDIPLDGEDFGSTSDSDNDLSEVLELSAFQSTQIVLALSGDGSRGPYNQFPKSSNFFTVSLQAPEQYFRCMIGRGMFDHLVYSLAPNPIFHSPWKKQHHVKFELAAFLVRYGQKGSDTLDVAAKLSIAHGTVHNYCKRVSQAIHAVGPQHLNWGNQEWRAAVSSAIEAKSGFPKCLGSGDGSQICFGELPLVDGEQTLIFGCVWILMSSHVKTNIQMTVDHERRFTSYELGWPGAVTDIKIFKNSHL